MGNGKRRGIFHARRSWTSRYSLAGRWPSHASPLFDSSPPWTSPPAPRKCRPTKADAGLQCPEWWRSRTRPGRGKRHWTTPPPSTSGCFRKAIRWIGPTGYAVYETVESPNTTQELGTYYYYYWGGCDGVRGHGILRSFRSGHACGGIYVGSKTHEGSHTPMSRGESPYEIRRKVVWCRDSACSTARLRTTCPPIFHNAWRVSGASRACSGRR